MKGETLPAASNWSGIPSEPTLVAATDLRQRSLAKICFRQSGNSVRQWAGRYARTLYAFAADQQAPAPSASGRIEQPAPRSLRAA